MDAHIRLKSDVSVIGSAADFAYKWALNAGLDTRDAARLSLAVDEVVTNVVRASGEGDDTFEMEFRRDVSQIEVIVREFGEPFDPDRHRYDSARALAEGRFVGAGMHLVEHFADEFVFINKGHAGKEFRIIKNIDATRIAVIRTQFPPAPGQAAVPASTLPTEDYVFAEAVPEDAEDIAKLIFHTYGYTYAKEEVYFPKRVEEALRERKRLAVVVRTPRGDAVAYFAMLRALDSCIGEVGEAVVLPAHRRRGLMTHMLEQLIGIARREGMRGLYGEAVTVHDISQRVNAKFGFHTTALLLADFPSTRYRDLVEDFPQDISVAIDFLFLDPPRSRQVYLPEKYRRILGKIYAQHGITVVQATDEGAPLPEGSQIDVRIDYTYRSAVLVVSEVGEDLSAVVTQTVSSLFEENVPVVYVDLPLFRPGAEEAVQQLEGHGFLLAGLMPVFHADQDYLRLQQTLSPIDMELVVAWSPVAREIKKRVESEMRWNTKRQKTG